MLFAALMDDEKVFLGLSALGKLPHWEKGGCFLSRVIIDCTSKAETSESSKVTMALEKLL